MAEERLTAEDWLKAGLKALAASGFTALKADVLARALGISRGSFYWHFANVDAFHVALLRRWRDVAVQDVIAELGRPDEDRLEALMARAFQADSRLEVAVRVWATSDKRARQMVEQVDAERLDYLAATLTAAGLAPPLAASRARLIYWTFLGRAFAVRAPEPALWRQIAADLSRLARAKP
jgi:AcrR family transcriptional regulator